MTSCLGAVLVVLAADPTFKDDAKALFEGCRGTPDSANSRMYSCRGWGAAIAETFAKVELDKGQRRALVLAGLHSMLPGDMTDTELLPRNSGARAVLSLRVKPMNSAKWSFGDGAMVELAPGHQRVAVCSAGASDEAATTRCAKVLAYLIDVGAPDGVELGTPPFSQEPVLLGRKLTVPAECKAEVSAENVGRILCPDSLLTWMLLPGAADPMKQAEATAREVARVQGLTIESKRVACRVEGKPGECVRLSGGDSQLIGARLEGTGTLVIACGSNDPKQPIKPVCGTALAPTPPGK